MSTNQIPNIPSSNALLQHAKSLLGAASSTTLREPLPDRERERLRSLVRRASIPFIESVIAAVDASGGVVAGVSFDTNEAREALSFLVAAEAIATEARAVLVALDDERLRRRAALADRALAIYASLGRQQRLPEGRTLLSHFRAMRALVARRRSRAVDVASPAPVPSGG